MTSDQQPRPAPKLVGAMSISPSGSNLDARISSGEFTDAGSTKEKLSRPVRQILAKDKLGPGVLAHCTVEQPPGHPLQAAKWQCGWRSRGGSGAPLQQNGCPKPVATSGKL